MPYLKIINDCIQYNCIFIISQINQLNQSKDRMKIVLLLMSLSICFILVQSLSFQLKSGQQPCFQVSGPGRYNIQYMVSGDSQENMTCLIKDQKGNTLKKIQRSSQGDQQVRFLGKSGQVCFHNLDRRTKMVSFDFSQVNSKNDRTKKLNEKQLSIDLYDALEQAHMNIHKLYIHQHFYVDINRVHKNKLEQVHSKSKIIFITKAFVILFGSFAQLFFIKKIIDNKGNNSYEPIQTI